MQILIALSQLLNTICGGYADESFSARAHRLHEFHKRWAFARLFVNTLLFDSEHCEKSYVSEVERRQLPPEYR